MGELPDLHEVPAIRIPSAFHSFAGKPFERCLICECDLLIDGQQYLIERALQGDEVIFEYAMCLACEADFKDELSRDSRMRIEAYFEERVDIIDRRADFVQRGIYDPAAWLDRCVVTKKPAAQCRQRMLYAHCDGPDMLFAYLPMMVSGEAGDDLIRLLSRKTRDHLGDFMEDKFGMPPEFRADPTRPQPLLL